VSEGLLLGNTSTEATNYWLTCPNLSHEPVTLPNAKCNVLVCWSICDSKPELITPPNNQAKIFLEQDCAGQLSFRTSL